VRSFTPSAIPLKISGLVLQSSKKDIHHVGHDQPTARVVQVTLLEGGNGAHPGVDVMRTFFFVITNIYGNFSYNVCPGSVITNGGEPKSCLSQVFNSKLGCSAKQGCKCMVFMQPLLKLKTRPNACPVG
jgi:hypothetical protein